MALETSLLLVASLFAIWWVVLVGLKKRGVLARHGASAFLFILVLRTQHGKKLLTRLSGPRMLWHWFSTVGVVATLATLAFMLFLALNALWVVWMVRPEPTLLNEPQNLLLIPGVNQFVPLVAGWVGLFVVIIVHEFSHAIMALVEGVRVKALGLIMALIPLGAFAELDAEQMFGVRSEAADVAGPTIAKKVAEPTVTPLQRMRIASAGVFANLLCAVVCFLLLYGVVFSAFQPTTHEMIIVGLDPNSSASLAGVPAGTVILSMGGSQVYTPQEYQAALSELHVGDQLALQVQLKHQPQVFNLTVYSPRVTFRDNPVQGACNLTSFGGERVNATFDFAATAQLLQPGEELRLGLECDGAVRYVEVQHPGGVLVTSASGGTPAAAAGRAAGDVLWAIDGRALGNISDFKDTMNATRPGQVVTLEYERSGQRRTVMLNLSVHPLNNTTGYLGVFTYPNINFSVDYPGVFGEGAVVEVNRTFLATYFRELPLSPQGWITILLLPVIPIEPYSGPGSYGTLVHTMLEPAPGWEWAGDGLYWVHDLLFWVGWISLAAAVFNALPMVPLDGGYVFRDGVFMLVRRLFRDQKKAEYLTAVVVSAMSGLIFFALVLMIIGPYILS